MDNSNKGPAIYENCTTAWWVIPQVGHPLLCMWAFHVMYYLYPFIVHVFFITPMFPSHNHVHIWAGLPFTSHLLAPGVCYCKGDPHCKPFDLSDELLMVGSCLYTLAQDGCDPTSSTAYDTYHIAANFERNKPSSPRSYVKELIITYIYPDSSIVVRLPFFIHHNYNHKSIFLNHATVKTLPERRVSPDGWCFTAYSTMSPWADYHTEAEPCSGDLQLNHWYHSIHCHIPLHQPTKCPTIFLHQRGPTCS